jgi:CheY-like chemotaxis protein
MIADKKSITILMAEDDPDDQMLLQKALEASHFLNEMHFVRDGEELLDYLYHRGLYSEPAKAPRPGLILLDLNLPKLDGRQVLANIKADANLRRIPVVVLTASQQQLDIHRSYELGASSYLTKPMQFESLVELMQTLRAYWFDIVELPPEPH